MSQDNPEEGSSLPAMVIASIVKGEKILFLAKALVAEMELDGIDCQNVNNAIANLTTTLEALKQVYVCKPK